MTQWLAAAHLHGICCGCRCRRRVDAVRREVVRDDVSKFLLAQFLRSRSRLLLLLLLLLL